MFHRTTTGPVITGIISADSFATIAATSNSILIAMSQSLVFDVRGARSTESGRHRDLCLPVVLLGLLTMVVSLLLHSSVKDLALSSVGLMAAGLINVRHGKGAYVADLRTGPIAALLTFGLTDDRTAFRQII